MLKSTFGAVTSELKWVYFTLSVRRGLLLSGQSRIAPPRLSAVLQCQMTIIGSGETHAPPLSSLRLLHDKPSAASASVWIAGADAQSDAPRSVVVGGIDALTCMLLFDGNCAPVQPQICMSSCMNSQQSSH